MGRSFKIRSKIIEFKLILEMIQKCDLPRARASLPVLLLAVGADIAVVDPVGATRAAVEATVAVEVSHLLGCLGLSEERLEEARDD